MTMYICCLCVYVISFSRLSSFHALTQVAALCSKQCHLKDEDVTYFTVLMEKVRKMIKL
jgi:uncharacterized membrane protein